VQRLCSEAVQHVRIQHRWQAIEEENQLAKAARQKGEKYHPVLLSNGDTKKQLLARSRYLLFKTENKWTPTQRKRAKLLFELYPDIEQAYRLSIAFRNIYEGARSRQHARQLFHQWKKKVKEKSLDVFEKVVASVQTHEHTILNYFVNRTTNALAESLNSKIKIFRSQFRGVRDIPFFLFRLANILA
jgi:transposase